MKPGLSSFWPLVASFVVFSGNFSTRGDTVVFFDAMQATNLVDVGVTSDTLNIHGYLFTFTRDKLFTGGVGLTNPIGRYIRVPWPEGLEAQAVTAGTNLSGARMTIKRQDGGTFAIQSFTFELLGNTGGAGASFEVMPTLNGEDMFRDPAAFNATGYYSQHFSYNTPQLTGGDTYKMALYVDFAITSLTIVDDDPSPPVLEMSSLSPAACRIAWPAECVGFTLQYCTNLAARTWFTVTNPAVNDGLNFTVDLPQSGAQRFYRLRK